MRYRARMDLTPEDVVADWMLAAPSLDDAVRMIHRAAMIRNPIGRRERIVTAMDWAIAYTTQALEEMAVKGAYGTPMETAEKVHRPAHYSRGREYEPIDVIDAWGLGFNTGNALKYIARAGRKGDAEEDLHKAIWYLTRTKQTGRL